MGFLFGKKETKQAMAEMLEDGRAIFEHEMKRMKYNEYHGKEPKLDMRVRVMPEFEVPWEATMKAGISCAFLLVPDVQVQVRYEVDKKEHVELDDDPQAIVARNPQLVKQA
jgi:hypothetical protein